MLSHYLLNLTLNILGKFPQQLVLNNLNAFNNITENFKMLPVDMQQFCFKIKLYFVNKDKKKSS